MYCIYEETLYQGEIIGEPRENELDFKAQAKFIIGEDEVICKTLETERYFPVPKTLIRNDLEFLIDKHLRYKIRQFDRIISNLETQQMEYVDLLTLLREGNLKIKGV